MPVVPAGQAEQLARGHHDRRGDVVLHLHLVGRDEVLPQLVESATRRRASTPDAQVAADQLAAVELQLVPGRAVDDVDA